MQLADIFTLEQHKYDDLIFLAAVLSVFLFFIVLLAFITNIYLPFKEQRDYIKMEMGRSVGNEYDYWKKELNRLYISHIPVIGLFVRKKH